MTKGSVSDGVVFHAGFPNAAEDESFGSLSLDALVVKHRASTFFWRLDVEIPELVWPKASLVVVDRSLTPKKGRVVVVSHGDEFLLARFFPDGFRLLDGEKVDAELWGVVTHVLQEVQ